MAAEPTVVSRQLPRWLRSSEAWQSRFANVPRYSAPTVPPIMAPFLHCVASVAGLGWFELSAESASDARRSGPSGLAPKTAEGAGWRSPAIGSWAQPALGRARKVQRMQMGRRDTGHLL